MRKKTIKVAYELPGIDYVIIDHKGKMWRLPYYNTQGKRYQLKEIKPFYERNYTAYQIFGKVYSLKQIEAMRVPKPYKVLIFENEIQYVYWSNGLTYRNTVYLQIIN